MHKEVNDILQIARVRLADWLSKYTPWHGDNGITERNLSFQFATAFLELYPSGLVFMEVPFSTAPNGPRSNHLDSYLHSTDFSFLLECKIVFSRSHIKAIAADIDRMSTELLTQIHERHLNPRPSRTYGVVLAETWYPKIADWWKGDDKVLPRWSRSDLPTDWYYNYLEVAKTTDGGDWTLYWLYAVSPEIKIP